MDGSNKISDTDLITMLQGDKTALVNASLGSQSNEEEDIIDESAKGTNEGGAYLNDEYEAYSDGDNSVEFNVDDEQHGDVNVKIENCNENAVESLSLNINESEIGLLNMLNDDPDDDPDDALEDGEEFKNEYEAPDDVMQSTGEANLEPESNKHCAICRNIFTEPKFLRCLHTFCQGCLEHKLKKGFRFIFCPICRIKTVLPDEGVASLPDNMVIASLITTGSGEQQSSECMICKLHGEEKVSAGQCIDCGDTLCEECCEKHTFSRQTAKHKVVLLEELESEQYVAVQRQRKMVFCMKHSDETASFFCSNCSIPICKECTKMGHRSHRYESLNEAGASRREAIQAQLEALGHMCESKLIDDSEQSEELIKEHEESAFKELKIARDRLISIVDQKYKDCVGQLQMEIDIKRRKYCKHKQAFIHNKRNDVEHVTKTVNLVLNEGSDVEIAILEKHITASIEHHKAQLLNVRPRLTNQSYFPRVHVYAQHFKVLEGLTLFSSDTIVREEKFKQREQMKAHDKLAGMHLASSEVRMNIGRGIQTGMNNVFAAGHPSQSRSLLALTSTSVRTPVGRGFPFQHSMNNRTVLLGSAPSLLGDYTVQNTYNRNWHGNLGENSSRTHQLSSKTQGKGNRGRERIDNKSPSQPSGSQVLASGQTFRLKLRSSVSAQVIQDQQQPNIVDLVFISQQNFAVADSRNLRLKVFSVSGKFLSYINDPGPTSVTYCANHLVWNSQFTSVKVSITHIHMIWFILVWAKAQC